MTSYLNFADEFTAKLRPESSHIALAYGFLDAAAVDEVIDDMSLGNNEVEAEFPEDLADPAYPVVATHDALFGIAGSMFLLPGAIVPGERVTVSMLASTLENVGVDQLDFIANTLNRSAAIINLAKVRRRPVDPHRALLVAKMVTGAQCWINWQNEDPSGGFIDTDKGLRPEPGTAIAFIVDCLAAAGCTYSNEEIRDAIPAMMDALGISKVVDEGFADAIA